MDRLGLLLLVFLFFNDFGQVASFKRSAFEHCGIERCDSGGCCLWTFKLDVGKACAYESLVIPDDVHMVYRLLAA